MKFVFVGNRRFVLDEMCRHKLKLAAIFAVTDSHLDKQLSYSSTGYTQINSRQDLLSKLEHLDFDVLVSNGCPYILPVDDISNKIYVNIHPSLLPDLRGIDPVIGAILFNRDAGATCHFMDKGVDTGDIISQVKIPYTPDLDVSLLYQLSFIAEQQVFTKSLQRDFVPTKKQQETDNLIYYSRTIEDRWISFEETNPRIINKIKAFSNKSQGCFFEYASETFKVHDITVLNNSYLTQYAAKFDNLQIILCYEATIVIKKDDQLLKLHNIVGNLEKIKLHTLVNDRARNSWSRSKVIKRYKEEI